MRWRHACDLYSCALNVFTVYVRKVNFTITPKKQPRRLSTPYLIFRVVQLTHNPSTIVHRSANLQGAAYTYVALAFFFCDLCTTSYIVTLCEDFFPPLLCITRFDGIDWSIV